MKVGEIRMEVPTFYSKAGLEVVGPQPCRVTYVHPLGRYYTVEFTAEATGEKWRECFYFQERCGNPRASAALKESRPRFEEIRKASRKTGLYGH